MADNALICSVFMRFGILASCTPHPQTLNPSPDTLLFYETFQKLQHSLLIALRSTGMRGLCESERGLGLYYGTATKTIGRYSVSKNKTNTRDCVQDPPRRNDVVNRRSWLSKVGTLCYLALPYITPSHSRTVHYLALHCTDIQREVNQD